MPRDPVAVGREADPDLQRVLAALEDDVCREIVTHLDRPMTANEVAEAAGIPLSTTYRKLDRLADATLLDERTDIREDGHHTTRYRVDFEAVRIALQGDRNFDLAVLRPAESADEQLERLWTEVRRET